MLNRRLARPALALALLLAASACSSPTRIQLALPQPNEGQLTEADAPRIKLVANPDTASDRELQQEKLSVAEALAYYRAKFRSLAAGCARN
jgi:hypothetical protein